MRVDWQHYFTIKLVAACTRVSWSTRCFLMFFTASAATFTTSGSLEIIAVLFALNCHQFDFLDTVFKELVATLQRQILRCLKSIDWVFVPAQGACQFLREGMRNDRELPATQASQYKPSARKSTIT